MWRPNPARTKHVQFLHMLSNGKQFDEYGNPVASLRRIYASAEVFPLSSAIKRQAFGIASEEAYTLFVTGVSIAEGDLAVLDGEVFRICSLSRLDPLQLVIKSTGETLQQFLSHTAVS